jgi:hypothetical protein
MGITDKNSSGTTLVSYGYTNNAAGLVVTQEARTWDAGSDTDTLGYTYTGTASSLPTWNLVVKPACSTWAQSTTSGVPRREIRTSSLSKPPGWVIVWIWGAVDKHPGV